MRVSLLLAGVAAASLTAFSAMAQEGQYEAGLTKMLTEAAAGRCPADVMGEQLLAACNAQISGMAPAMASLGAIEEMTFMSADEVEGKRHEVYRVRFASGQVLTWRIGGLTEGRFDTAGTVRE